MCAKKSPGQKHQAGTCRPAIAVCSGKYLIFLFQEEDLLCFVCLGAGSHFQISDEQVRSQERDAGAQHASFDPSKLTSDWSPGFIDSSGTILFPAYRGKSSPTWGNVLPPWLHYSVPSVQPFPTWRWSSPNTTSAMADDHLEVCYCSYRTALADAIQFKSPGEKKRIHNSRHLNDNNIE